MHDSTLKTYTCNLSVFYLALTTFAPELIYCLNNKLHACHAAF